MTSCSLHALLAIHQCRPRERRETRLPASRLQNPPRSPGTSPANRPTSYRMTNHPRLQRQTHLLITFNGFKTGSKTFLRMVSHNQNSLEFNHGSGSAIVISPTGTGKRTLYESLRFLFSLLIQRPDYCSNHFGFTDKVGGKQAARTEVENSISSRGITSIG
jgi:hypothetical protein